jgi:predicted nucleotidyltransferase
MQFGKSKRTRFGRHIVGFLLRQPRVWILRLALTGYTVAVEIGAVLDDIVSGLRKDEGVTGIVVFGSLAQDVLSRLSDIDLLVIHRSETRLSKLRDHQDLIDRRSVQLQIEVVAVHFTTNAIRREFELWDVA